MTELPLNQRRPWQSSSPRRRFLFEHASAVGYTLCCGMNKIPKGVAILLGIVVCALVCAMIVNPKDDPGTVGAIGVVALLLCAVFFLK